MLSQQWPRSRRTAGSAGDRAAAARRTARTTCWSSSRAWPQSTRSHGGSASGPSRWPVAGWRDAALARMESALMRGDGSTERELERENDTLQDALTRSAIQLELLQRELGIPARGPSRRVRTPERRRGHEPHNLLRYGEPDVLVRDPWGVAAVQDDVKVSGTLHSVGDGGEEPNEVAEQGRPASPCVGPSPSRAARGAPSWCASLSPCPGSPAPRPSP
jgi:hypothetical protein